MWLFFLICFIALWMIELVFGWLYGAHLRGLLTVAALIYFAITINALKTSQAELQRELKRLWKMVKALQETGIAPEHSQTAQMHTVNVDNQAVNAEEINAETKKSSYGETIAESVVSTIANDATSSELPLSAMPAAASKPVLSKAMPIPTELENLPPPQYDWSDVDRSSLPQPPNIFEEWLAGGNWIVRSGLAILFIGLVFLAKFAYDNALLPLELRLAAIAGVALALLIIGWRARLNRPTYGLSLQGGGVAALYLTVFATAKLTAMLPPMLAMVLMLVIAVLAASLAIQQNAMILAVIGTIGGFMAPILMSTGQGSHIALFSYFVALDIGILTIALRKAWRPLNVLAFFFTYGVAGLWASRSYQSSHQLSCLLFLTLFFVLFTVVSALFSKRQIELDEPQRTVDPTLLFGVPTATFGYGLYLLKSYEYGGAWLAVLLSTVYLLLAYFAKNKDSFEPLKMPWAALSLLLATLAVPLAFDARLTSSIWALEGAAVISYGWQQKQTKTRWFGYLLVLLGTLGFVTHWPEVSGSVPIFNALTIGLLVLTLAYGVIGWAVNRADKTANPVLAGSTSDEALLMSWLMAVVMALTGTLIIATELYSRNSLAVASIAVPVMLWLWAFVLQRISHFANWPQVVAPVIILPLLTLLLPIYHSWLRVGLTTLGLIWTALALSFLMICQALVLKRILPDLKTLFKDNVLPSLIAAIPGFTLVAYWVTLLVRGRNTLSSALIPESGLTMHGWFMPLANALPIVLLWWLAGNKTAANSPVIWRWLHGDDELPSAAVNKQLKVFAFLTLIFIIATALLHSGRGSYGLTYIPVLNLYELVASAGLFAMLRLFRNTDIGETILGDNRSKFLSVLAFVFANSILSRILVNFFGAEFSVGFAWHSAIAATTYSIVWTFTALLMMWFASKRMARGLWITGALLLGIVAIKLLVIDLSKVGSLARIISFIGVGVLMLVVGYVAPIPAENKANSSANE